MRQTLTLSTRRCGRIVISRDRRHGDFWGLWGRRRMPFRRRRNPARFHARLSLKSLVSASWGRLVAKLFICGPISFEGWRLGDAAWIGYDQAELGDDWLDPTYRGFLERGDLRLQSCLFSVIVGAFRLGRRDRGKLRDHGVDWRCISGEGGIGKGNQHTPLARYS